MRNTQTVATARHYRRAEDVPAAVANDFTVAFTAGIEAGEELPDAYDRGDYEDDAFEREFYGYEYEDPRDPELYEGSVGCSYPSQAEADYRRMVLP